MAILDTIQSPKDLKELDVPKLKVLAAEIRKFLVESVAKTGGHLASNLGVVELTIALHKVFDAPKDAIIWDVGHQSYVHKLLTGRKKGFDTLRQYGGLSGFPRSCESEYDAFDTGHSSTSISAALGFVCARDMKGEDNSVVAVIGDGAMSGGLAYEGLNNAGRLKSNFIVVLNNNEMSISKNVGSMSRYLNHLRTDPFYHRTKENVHDFLDKVPLLGKPAASAIHAAKEGIRRMVVQPSIFEELGFTCIGPVDGHDVEQLLDVLSKAKEIKGPVMVHVYTKKGKGYTLAEKDPAMFHGIGKFDVKTGVPEPCCKGMVSISKLFGDQMVKTAQKKANLVAITAAMPSGTGLIPFAKTYPKRFFDVGIAEQHAVTFAGGLAKNGFVPVVAVYSTFLQRAYDQIFHDVALQNLHVVFALDRAGLVGADGETHHGILDLSYLTSIENLSVLAPSSPKQFEEMLDYAIFQHQGPIALRYPKAMPAYENRESFVFGKACIEQEGTDITVIAAGNMVQTALEAAKLSGKSVEVIDVRTVKPIDKETILNSANKTGKVITIEDNVKIGGMGSIVAAFCPKVAVMLGYDDKPIRHGSLKDLYRETGMDAAAIAAVIQRECGNEKTS